MVQLGCDERGTISVIEQATAIEYIEDALNLSEENNSELEYIDRLGLTLMKLSPDTVVSADAAFEDVYRDTMRVAIENVLETLKPRERQVICERYSLSDGIEKTLEEIGFSMNVTRERIRQIEAKALRKLQCPSKAKYLQDLYE